MVRRFALLLVLSLAVADPAQSSTAEAGRPVADQVVVDKRARTLTLYAQGRPLRVIAGIQLGDAPVFR